MAKNKMQIKYKKPKRERNKYNNELQDEIKLKSFLINLFSVLSFIVLVYLGVIGLKSLGLFDQGYIKPTKESTTINYEYILYGTVFDRKEKEYYVIFDNYDKNINSYINNLITSKSKIPVYKVDLSKKENEGCISSKSNSKAKNANELEINDLTLIRITNGKISKYFTGSAAIEAQFK